jgi:hypothetical protein
MVPVSLSAKGVAAEAAASPAASQTTWQQARARGVMNFSVGTLAIAHFACDGNKVQREVEPQQRAASVSLAADHCHNTVNAGIDKQHFALYERGLQILRLWHQLGHRGGDRL